MKKYLADILTLTRVVLALILLAGAFLNMPIFVGLLVFLFAELTDAFDGTCAAKWPFPKNKIPKYRKYSAKFDIFADGLLAFAMMMFFTLRVNLIAGLIIYISYPLIGTILEYIVYGKFMGHPDDCTKNCLMRRNFKKAKTIIMVRRKVYLGLIILVSVWTLYASELTMTFKIIATITAALVGVFLWFFLSQRRHFISRDATEIEDKLSRQK